MSGEVYKLLKNDIFGRYIVANKNIKQGELILKEKPALVGPQIDGPLICFNCCKNISFSGHISCRTCKIAPICSPKCPGVFHHDKECEALKSSPWQTEDISTHHQIIFALRCILLKNSNPETWRIFTELEPHLEKRYNTPIWRKHQITIEEIFKEKQFVSQQELQEQLVQKICGILDVNTFEVRPPINVSQPEVQCLRGLYLKAALMAHDCLGNTHLSVDNNYELSVHASVDIPENSPIFFNYSNVLQGTTERQEHLREGKYFDCNCGRCNDPTEFQTEISSLLCNKCRKGFVRSKSETSWSCSDCPNILPKILVKLSVDEGKRNLEDVDIANVDDLESLLRKFLRTFHANHYLILELKQNLIALYTRLVPNKKQLARKIELCQPLLDVIRKLEPGISRIAAITMYEMHSAEVDLAHKQFRCKDITLTELVAKLSSAENNLKVAIKYLLYEPSNSPEGFMAQKAMSELKMLRVSIGNIQKDLLLNGRKNDEEAKICENGEKKTSSSRNKRSKNKKKK